MLFDTGDTVEKTGMFTLRGPMGLSLAGALLATVALGGYFGLTALGTADRQPSAVIEVTPLAPPIEESAASGVLLPSGGPETVITQVPRGQRPGSAVPDAAALAEDGSSGRHPTIRVVRGAPPVVPRLRPQTADVTVLRLARGLTTEQALALPRPVLRPEAVAVRDTIIAALDQGADIETPVLGGQPDVPLRRPVPRPDRLVPAERVAEAPEAASEEQPLSPLIVASSPLPQPRSPRLAALARARIVAPASPVQPAPETVTVARAEPLDDTVQSARLEVPDIGIDKGPRMSACSAAMARGIPRRPGNAPGGSSVINAVAGIGGASRDGRIVSEVLRGNVPDSIRTLRPVHLRGTVSGRPTDITVCVTSDYLAVGSDGDNIRVPLGLPAAMQVARSFDMVLPTTRIVDAVYRQADLKVAPSPMTPGPQMSSTAYFAQHDQTVDAQIRSRTSRGDLLTAGHKKDLVIANRLNEMWGRVAIYGWHRTNGTPIQPLSTVHGANYADYSHGIRLVARTAIVDGRAVDLMDLLADPQYAAVLNSDGPLRNTARYASLQ
ncbi:hypothetical protein [Anianabacter salinae]|uniref:hypothetical protein n=1 Tax=Anianabacter salinae TaxID=2851023 RepID=UPI00225E15B8|nr:hypothetical protein [Anianabacter salinae]MBV0911807.1 hypothetical protein [Anianabacter salinae]